MLLSLLVLSTDADGTLQTISSTKPVIGDSHKRKDKRLTHSVLVQFLLLYDSFVAYESSATFLAIISFFCFRATITLNRSKSERLARFFLAANFFAQLDDSHLFMVSAVSQAFFKEV